MTERTQLKAPDVIVQKGFCKTLGMQVVWNPKVFFTASTLQVDEQHILLRLPLFHMLLYFDSRPSIQCVLVLRIFAFTRKPTDTSTLVTQKPAHPLAAKISKSWTSL